MNTLLHWAVSAASLMLTAYFVPGFEVSSFVAALIAAVIIGLVNSLLWPLLIVLTLPINIVTFGLFTFVVNGIILKVSALLIPGFDVRTWGAAIIGAIVLSVISAGMHYLLV